MSISFDLPDTFVSYPILQGKKPRFREVLPLRVAQGTSEGIVIRTQFLSELQSWCELYVTCNLPEFKKLLFSLYHPCRLHGVGEGGPGWQRLLVGRTPWEPGGRAGRGFGQQDSHDLAWPLQVISLFQDGDRPWQHPYEDARTLSPSA